jgi:hypothetical protein
MFQTRFILDFLSASRSSGTLGFSKHWDFQSKDVASGNARHLKSRWSHQMVETEHWKFSASEKPCSEVSELPPSSVESERLCSAAGSVWTETCHQSYKGWNSRVKCPSVILRKLHGWLMNFCGNFHHCVVTEAATIWVLCPCEQDLVVWSV